MTEQNKIPQTIKITITPTYIVVAAVGFLIAWFAIPTQQSKIEKLNNRIERLSDQVVIYELNETQSDSISAIVQKKTREIDALKINRDEYKNKYEILSKSLNAITNENVELKNKYRILNKENQVLKEKVKIINENTKVTVVNEKVGPNEN